MIQYHNFVIHVKTFSKFNSNNFKCLEELPSYKNEMSKTVQASRSMLDFLKKNIIKGNSITSIALVKPYFSKLHIRIVVHDDILMNIYSAT